jgi:hypothetical protein
MSAAVLVQQAAAFVYLPVEGVVVVLELPVVELEPELRVEVLPAVELQVEVLRAEKVEELYGLLMQVPEIFFLMIEPVLLHLFWVQIF